MLFEQVWILDEHFACVPNMYVGIEDDKISYIGQNRPGKDFGEVIDGKGKLLMPGLVNAHCHAGMTLLRGYAENLSLHDWLNKKVFPFEAKISQDDMYSASMLGFLEMLRFGVTTVADMYFMCDGLYDAVLNSGIRANLCWGITCFDDGNLEDLPAFKVFEDALAKRQGDGQGRLRIDAGVHAEYTSTPKVVRQLGQFAKEKKLGLQVHLSETRQEHEECIARHGCTPAAYFERQGLFETNVTAAHCVHVSADDLAILARNKVSIAHNPVSNLKLASGVLNIKQVLDAGVNLCLGTDGAASNNNLNLFEEMKLAAILAKASAKDAQAVTPAQILFAATRGGALALGWEDVGLLKEGYKADLALLNIDTPWMTPVHAMENNLVYSAQGSDVCMTVVDGRIVYKNGEFPGLNAKAIQAEVERRAGALVKQIVEE